MGANEAKSVILGMCQVDGNTTPGTPVFNSNSGLFTGVNFVAEGLYTLDIDSDQELDVNAIQPIPYAVDNPAAVIIGLSSPTLLLVSCFNLVGVARDLTFSLVVYGLSGAQVAE